MHASAHGSHAGPSSETLSRDYPAFAQARRDATGPFLLLCEHASPNVPPCYAGLGLDASERERHIGWDIGALDLASALSEALDSPLIHATQSRLLMDLNRDPAAVDAIPANSDGTTIPANQKLHRAELQRRRQWLYEPFHATVDALRARRMSQGLPTAVVSIHSFTPQMAGFQRPWHIGVLSDTDRRLADSLLAVLRAHPDVCVGDNQPYAPHQGVYHSVGRHGVQHGLPNVMIEVRNDLLRSAAEISRWSQLLGHALRLACSEVGMR